MKRMVCVSPTSSNNPQTLKLDLATYDRRRLRISTLSFSLYLPLSLLVWNIFMSNSNNGQATAFILPSPVLFRTSTLETYNMPSDRNLRFSMARMAKGKGGGGPRAKATGGKKKKAKGPAPGGGKNKNGDNKKSRKKKDSNSDPGSNGKSPSAHLPRWQVC